MKKYNKAHFEEALRNFKYIQDKFVKVDLVFRDPDIRFQLDLWIKQNTKSLVLDSSQWNMLNSDSYESFMEEPKMDDILASIRRIISEDSDELNVKVSYWFLEPNEAMLYKLVWGGRE